MDLFSSFNKAVRLMEEIKTCLETLRDGSSQTQRYWGQYIRLLVILLIHLASLQ